MAYKVAGGSKWWQVRAGPGVEAEWIVMKKDWKEYEKSQRPSAGVSPVDETGKNKADSHSRDKSGAGSPRPTPVNDETAEDSGCECVASGRRADRQSERR